MTQQSGQLMTKKLVTVRMEDSVRMAYQVMNEKKIRHLPVTDNKGEIIGIISDRDLKRAMVPTVQSDLSRVMSGDKEVDFFPDHQTKDYMSWPACTVSESTSVHEVAELILKDKISAVLVIDHHQAVKGIITTDDLLKLLLKFLDKSPEQKNTPVKSFIDYYNWSQLHWA